MLKTVFLYYITKAYFSALDTSRLDVDCLIRYRLFLLHYFRSFITYTIMSLMDHKNRVKTVRDDEMCILIYSTNCCTKSKLESLTEF